MRATRWSSVPQTSPRRSGCRFPLCTNGFSRGYLAYLLRLKEITAARLLTLHNLSYLARLMADLRAAVDEGRLAERIAEFRAGAAPRVFTDASGAPLPGAPLLAST